MRTRKKKKSKSKKVQSETEKEFITAINELTRIEEKLKNNYSLTLEEMDVYGSKELLDKDILDLDEELRPYKFKRLYITFKDDLTFKGEYFKKNKDVKISDYVSLETLRSLGKEQFNQERFDSLLHYLRINKVEIPIGPAEIHNSQAYLESIALWWGRECAVENHTDKELYSIAVETRDKEVLGLKNIKAYIDGGNDLSTFKGLLKSYYSYLEAIVLYRKIKKNSEPDIFEFNGVSINYTLTSIFHILYRHYAQQVAPDLITKKSFFTPEIPPENIHFLLNNLFAKIKQNKLFLSVAIESVNITIFFRYKAVYYAVAIGPDKHNKSRVIIKSFFPMEETHDEGQLILNKIKNSALYNSNYLGDSITVYTRK